MRIVRSFGHWLENLMRLGVISLGLLSPYAMANQSTNDLFAMNLQQLMAVTITGSTLTEKNIKTVPSATTVFTHEQIKRLGLDSLDELMNLVPGYQSYRSSSTSVIASISSRGRRISVDSAEILVLVDGQRMNAPASGGIGNVTAMFPLAQIERVEFIRGSGSAIYGSNAMSGVINIITRSGVNEVSAAYGSFDRYRADVFASKQIGELKADFYGNYDTDNGDDYQVQDTFSSNRISTNDPRELAELNIKLQWRDTQVNLKHRQTDSEDFYVGTRLSNGFNRNKFRYSSASLKQAFEWQSISSWLYFSYSQTQFFGNIQLSAPGTFFTESGGVSNAPLLSKSDFGKDSEMRAQWHNDWHINAESDLQFGVEYRHLDSAKAKANRNFDLVALAAGNLPIGYSDTFDFSADIQQKTNRDIFGIYSQYQRQLFEQTQLTMGLRYDHFSSIDGHLSPRVALVHDFNKQHAIKLLYGEAFRAPSEEELNFVSNAVLLGNPNLKAETVKSWDLIWVAQWAQTSLSLGYFESHFDDAITLLGISGGRLQYMNVGEDGDAKGVEFEISHALNNHWLLRGTYTHIFEKPDSGLSEAEKLASFMVNYQQGKWNANLLATYRGKSGGGSRITLDEQWQLASKLSYQFNSQWQGFVQVKNLLDEDSLTSAPAGPNLIEGIPNRGREMLVGGVWTF